MRAGHVILSLLLVPALHPGRLTSVAAESRAGVPMMVGIVLAGIGVWMAFDSELLEEDDGEDLSKVEQDIEDIWETISAQDQDGCARKLICLLEAAGGAVDSDEAAVLGTLGYRPEMSMSQPQKTAKLPFEAAGRLGKLRGASACEHKYGASCPFSRAEMVEFINSAEDLGD